VITTGSSGFRPPDDPSQVITVNVTLSGDDVFLDVGGKDPADDSALRYVVLDERWKA
jgi:hypothetical protein